MDFVVPTPRQHVCSERIEKLRAHDGTSCGTDYPGAAKRFPLTTTATAGPMLR